MICNTNLQNAKVYYSYLAILKKSGPIPQGPFVARKDIQYDDRLRVEDALLTVGDNLSIIRTLGIGGFAKIEDDSYKDLRQIVRDMNFNLSNLVV